MPDKNQLTQIIELKQTVEKLVSDNLELHSRLTSLEKKWETLGGKKSQEDMPVPLCEVEECGKMLHRVKFYSNQKIVESDYYCIEHGHQWIKDSEFFKENESEIEGDDESRIQESE